MRRLFLFLATLFAAAAALFTFVVRPRYHRWGLQQGDLERPLPGDELVPKANYRADLAMTVDAKPADIWPWLAQLGRGRGGLYSYDWLDRLFGVLDAPSSDAILPEWQHLAPGDVIPIGTAGGFPVVEAEAGNHLLLGDTENGMWSWLLYLEPLPDGRTRIISRNFGRLPRTFAGGVLRMWLDPAAFIMTRKMLLNLRERAEDLAWERRPPLHDSPAPLRPVTD